MADDIEWHAVDEHGEHITRIIPGTPPATDHTFIPTAELERLRFEGQNADVLRQDNTQLREEITRLRTNAEKDVCSGCMQREEQRDRWMEVCRQMGVELEQLRLIARVNGGLHRSAHEDAEKAETELERMTTAARLANGHALEAEAAITRVRDLHQPVDVEFARGARLEQGETGDVRYRRKCCSHCADEQYGLPVDWPCPTARALDGEPT
ncbi:hypothetical protein ACLQ2R_17460 [Streptosporangium sp. DT93]|uniref:hypothetical protein n=1 Tax=Streptosporangium sp. DT93 TaxID=3393428 RepID=UPI003CE7DF53